MPINFDDSTWKAAQHAADLLNAPAVQRHLDLLTSPAVQQQLQILETVYQNEAVASALRYAEVFHRLMDDFGLPGMDPDLETFFHNPESEPV